MYIALTEVRAKEIRKLGISVIEWKNCVRKSVNVAVYIINKTADKIAQAWKIITDAIDDFVDIAALVVEEMREKLHCPVSRRYKFVKILGNMRYNKQRVWTLTRHTWLARSNC